MAVRSNLCLSHLSRSFIQGGSLLLASSQHLALVGAQLTVPSLNLQVCEWRSPEQLKQLLDLEMRDTGEPHHRLLRLCQDVIHYSVKTSKSLNLFPFSVPLTSSYIFLSMYLPLSKVEYDNVYGMRNLDQKIVVLIFSQ